MKIAILYLLLTCAAVSQTRPVIIVVRADKATLANQAAKQIDVLKGEYTFTVPLTKTGTDTAAYWCSWMMTAAHAIDIRTHLTNRTGITFTNPATGKWYGKLSAQVVLAVYDGTVWTSSAVLADLGLSVLQRAIP